MRRMKLRRNKLGRLLRSIEVACPPLKLKGGQHRKTVLTLLLFLLLFYSTYLPQSPRSDFRAEQDWYCPFCRSPLLSFSFVVLLSFSFSFVVRRSFVVRCLLRRWLFMVVT